MNNVVVVQAREGSNRLPKKVLKNLFGNTVLENVVSKCSKLKNITETIVATTPNSLEIKKICIENQYKFYEGSEKNVLKRFTDIIEKYNIDNLIRISSDCPFFDESIAQFTIDKFLECYPDFDYASNTIKKTFPQGFDIEIIKSSILTNLNKSNLDQEDLEHVTINIRKNAHLYNAISIINKEDHGKYRLTLDTNEDYKILKWISSHYKDIGEIQYDSKLKQILNSKNYREYNNLFESDSLVNKFLKNKFSKTLEVQFTI